MIALVALCQAEASRVPGQTQICGKRPPLPGTPRENHSQCLCRWREAEYLLGSRLDRQRAVEASSSRGRRQLIPPPHCFVHVSNDWPSKPASRSSQRSQLAAAPALGRRPRLTPRELEVLGQLARGRTDHQIAEELFISKKTASVHVSNLLRKLDATSRIEAAEIGRRAALV